MFWQGALHGPVCWRSAPGARAGATCTAHYPVRECSVGASPRRGPPARMPIGWAWVHADRARREGWRYIHQKQRKDARSPRGQQASSAYSLIKMGHRTRSFHNTDPLSRPIPAYLPQPAWLAGVCSRSQFLQGNCFVARLCYGALWKGQSFSDSFGWAKNGTKFSAKSR